MLAVGNLSWESGYDYLLTAFSKTHSIDNLILTIVGTGSLYSAIKYTVEDLKIDKNVCFVNKTPNLEELSDLINKSDIYVNFCVKYEPAMADEMAFKLNKSIVCTNVNSFLAKQKSKNINVIPTRSIRTLSKYINVK